MSWYSCSLNDARHPVAALGELIDSRFTGAHEREFGRNKEAVDRDEAEHRRELDEIARHRGITPADPDALGTYGAGSAVNGNRGTASRIPCRAIST
jgi:hypothetical protein